MYCTHNDGKSVLAESFIKTLNTKTYKIKTTNDSNSYLSYLNKFGRSIQ